jgi:hypothetical protein
MNARVCHSLLQVCFMVVMAIPMQWGSWGGGEAMETSSSGYYKGLGLHPNLRGHDWEVRTDPHKRRIRQDLLSGKKDSDKSFLFCQNSKTELLSLCLKEV